MSEGMKYPWGGRRRFNSYSEYIRGRFGYRVQKLTIDAGFTCPNRDGSKGRGGCAYCNNEAFNPAYCEPEKPVSLQMSQGIDFHKRRYSKARKYLAYFQAYSNTYASAGILRKRYNEALENEDVIGLVIGTRPDCVDDEILDLLSEFNEKTYLTVEYGIESCYDHTLERINRGHDFAATVDALKRTSERGIRTGGHMIFGLPGENREDIINEASILSSLPVDQLKFHQLQVVKGSLMAKEYLEDPGRFPEPGLVEYLLLVSDFIERLDPKIVIERISGESNPELNLRKSWGIRYDRVLSEFEKLLEERDTWQGKYFEINNSAKEI